MSISRQLAAIMFTDIEGYTALMQQNEQKAIEVRDKHRRIFNSVTEKHKGKVLQYYGDGTLSIFDSAIDAVHCGIELQQGLLETPAIPVRIGIHMGDIIFSEEEIIGDSVNVAARIESLAVAGSVLISGKVYDEIKNQVSIRSIWLKTVKFKNVARPLEVYAIANPGLVVPEPTSLSGKTEPDPASPPEKPAQPDASLPYTAPPAQILATKLYIPSPRPNAVRRPRLLARLHGGITGKLTLISASAGFGKTTLVSEWVEELRFTNPDLRFTSDDLRFTNPVEQEDAASIVNCIPEIPDPTLINRTSEIPPRGIAWLSLEEGDSNPSRFLTYVVAALQRLNPDIGAAVLPMLQSPQLPPIESILTVLINEINSMAPFVLVLDDYHVIESPEIDQGLVFLLDHQPPWMHLVIATREDPSLPLARLRVRGQLTELRAIDLRFMPDEAAAFLRQVMGLELSREDIAALEIRTEGWIAGLQMAALTLQGRSDTASFIQAFTGSHRFVLDYLVEEVLQRQPESVRHFLLQTAMLDRLCGPLCDAVTNGEGGQALLDTLERGNLFVVPLDGRRQWYRYHHLFADVLRAYAAEKQPEVLPLLHQRASDWYAQADLYPEAIHHALAAADFVRTATLLELVWPEMDGRFQSEAWLAWAKKIPSEIVLVRPVLGLAYAWAWLNRGDMEAGESQLKAAEQGLEPSPQRVIVDEEQFRFLPASIATARAYIAQARGDIPATVRHARQALDHLPADDHLRRGPAAALLGLAEWADGALEAAHRSIADAMANFERVGNLHFAISGTYGMADILIAQGRLRAAIRTYERAMKLVQEQGEPLLRGTADLYLGLGELYREQGDTEAAVQYLNKSAELGESLALPDWPCRMREAQARMQALRGDLNGALDQLAEAERLYYQSPVPNLRPIAAQRARIWLRQGRLAEAAAWARAESLSADDALTYLREFEHLTLVRIFLAQHEQDAATDVLPAAEKLLERLLQAAEAGERMGSVIEILILQALVLDAQGKSALALAALARALQLAAPEGYVRIFVDEGSPMIRLLREATTQHGMQPYVSRLLAASEAEQPSQSDPLSRSAAHPLVEPLSARELEVLQLIEKGLSNQEISDRLFLALTTVKGHNRNIFGKLGVQRRTEAVARARELGVL